MKPAARHGRTYCSGLRVKLTRLQTSLAECEKLAEGAANPRVQAILGNMARTWTKLALEAEQTLKQSRPLLQLIAPILRSLPLHCRRLRVLVLDPVRRARRIGSSSRTEAPAVKREAEED